MLGSGNGGAAIGWHDDLIVPHMGVGCCQLYADVGGQACQDQAFCADEAQQGLQGGSEKTGMLWLENEVILFSRYQQPDDGRAAYAIEILAHHGSKIRAPLAKVVVQIDRRYARRCRSLL